MALLCGFITLMSIFVAKARYITHGGRSTRLYLRFRSTEQWGFRGRFRLFRNAMFKLTAGGANIQVCRTISLHSIVMKWTVLSRLGIWSLNEFLSIILALGGFHASLNNSSWVSVNRCRRLRRAPNYDITYKLRTSVNIPMWIDPSATWNMKLRCKLKDSNSPSYQVLFTTDKVIPPWGW
jgi:hypothetical protein